MWNPGIRYAECGSAMLWGYHRRFCVYSHRYRGTPTRPGLVLGLDRGGACRGMAYRVTARNAKEALLYLWERELKGGVYEMRTVLVRLPRKTVSAYAFVVDRGHRGYAGTLSPEETARFILQGHGQRGPCLHYLENTIEHLETLGFADGPLHRLGVLARRLDRERIARGEPDPCLDQAPGATKPRRKISGGDAAGRRARGRRNKP
jgi:cation transport protein ChaC